METAIGFQETQEQQLAQGQQHLILHLHLPLEHLQHLVVRHQILHLIQLELLAHQIKQQKDKVQIIILQ